MVEVGMVIKHTSLDCKWTAEFTRIEDNDLFAILRSESGGQWTETWNLAHTESGLKSGEYVEILL